ncbi:DJ-1/PfpI family protein [Streptomyces sp. AC563]|nr:DJ-1/PfpI family protein [Streptomyces buecherae]MBC3989458.1 DJ-1/PfpI family protein [Streptomyces buecherae]QNJ42853.1 DJ-1/PfpI family protein [Streptomyces buecherae]
MNTVTPVNVGVLFFEEVEELDAVGPWEVLGYWAHHVASFPVRIFAIGREAGVVRCSKGLGLTMDYDVEHAPRLDLLVHPGGDGTNVLQEDEHHLKWLRELHGEGTLLASVCTGSLVFAAAGLLAGQPATTHWRYGQFFADIDTSVDVRVEERFVDNGTVVTSAGVSAGIDMALHLVGRMDSPEAAETVRQGIQYAA